MAEKQEETDSIILMDDTLEAEISRLETTLVDLEDDKDLPDVSNIPYELEEGEIMDSIIENNGTDFGLSQNEFVKSHFRDLSLYTIDSTDGEISDSDEEVKILLGKKKANFDNCNDKSKYMSSNNDSYDHKYRKYVLSPPHLLLPPHKKSKENMQTNNRHTGISSSTTESKQNTADSIKYYNEDKNSYDQSLISNNCNINRREGKSNGLFKDENFAVTRVCSSRNYEYDNIIITRTIVQKPSENKRYESSQSSLKLEVKDSKKKTVNQDPSQDLCIDLDISKEAEDVLLHSEDSSDEKYLDVHANTNIISSTPCRLKIDSLKRWQPKFLPHKESFLVLDELGESSDQEHSGNISTEPSSQVTAENEYNETTLTNKFLNETIEEINLVSPIKPTSPLPAKISCDLGDTEYKSTKTESLSSSLDNNFTDTFNTKNCNTYNIRPKSTSPYMFTENDSVKKATKTCSDLLPKSISSSIFSESNENKKHVKACFEKRPKSTSPNLFSDKIKDERVTERPNSTPPNIFDGKCIQERLNAFSDMRQMISLKNSIAGSKNDPKKENSSHEIEKRHVALKESGDLKVVINTSKPKTPDIPVLPLPVSAQETKTNLDVASIQNESSVIVSMPNNNVSNSESRNKEEQEIVKTKTEPSESISDAGKIKSLDSTEIKSLDSSDILSLDCSEIKSLDSSESKVLDCNGNKSLNSNESSINTEQDIEIIKVVPPVSTIKETIPKVPKYDEEYVSNDPEENADNNNPEWELLRKLETDEERYRAMRKRWKNLIIPDPNQDLTFRNWRLNHNASVVSASTIGTSISTDCPSTSGIGLKKEDAPRTENRKRNRTADSVSVKSEPKEKRARTQSCTTIYDVKLQRLRESVVNEKQRIDNEEQLELLQLSLRQSEELDKLQRTCPGYSAESAVLDLLYEQQGDVERIHMKFAEARRAVEESCTNKTKILEKACEEVEAFHRFYQGLDHKSESDDAFYLTDSQLQELWETERLYEEYKKFYSV